MLSTSMQKHYNTVTLSISSTQPILGHPIDLQLDLDLLSTWATNNSWSSFDDL